MTQLIIFLQTSTICQSWIKSLMRIRLTTIRAPKNYHGLNRWQKHLIKLNAQIMCLSTDHSLKYLRKSRSVAIYRPQRI